MYGYGSGNNDDDGKSPWSSSKKVTVARALPCLVMSFNGMALVYMFAEQKQH